MYLYIAIFFPMGISGLHYVKALHFNCAGTSALPRRTCWHLWGPDPEDSPWTYQANGSSYHKRKTWLSTVRYTGQKFSIFNTFWYTINVMSWDEYTVLTWTIQAVQTQTCTIMKVWQISRDSKGAGRAPAAPTSWEILTSTALARGADSVLETNLLPNDRCVTGE